MTILVFDWETTNKWNFKAELNHKDPTQPKPVQLAAILLDSALNEMSSISVLVNPSTKWTIPENASNIHGINQDTALKFGLSLPAVMEIFLQLADAADTIVGHNVEFDTNITLHALHLIGETENPFDGKEIRCTMKAAKKILKLPNRNPYINDPYKFPRLEECIKHFFDEDFEGAHNALYDVRGTIRVYREICRITGSPH